MAPIQDLRRQFVQAALNAPYLEREEESLLARQWREQGDKKALDRLTHAHMRLVIALASRFRHYGLPMADLVQEGHIGLMEAAARFEADRDVRFSTYAAWWVRASIQDHVLRNWSIVRGGTSSSQKALFFNLRRLRAKLAQSDGGTLELSGVHRQIAETLGVSEADVAQMDARLAGSDLSLNAPLGQDDPLSERMDFLIDTQPLPDETTETAIDGERRLGWLKNAMKSLNERELQIIRERRLRDGDEATLESLGASLGISKERVRQIENRALEKLKAALLQQVAKVRGAGKLIPSRT